MKRTGIVGATVALLVIATTVAAMAGPDADAEETVVEWSYDDATSQLTWWLAPVGDEDPVECVDTAVIDEACHVVDVRPAADGEPNHGAFVSAFVHSLKDLDLDVPRGWLVRQVAQSDLGKGDDDGSAEVEEVDEVEPDDELEADVAPSGHHGKPDHPGKSDDPHGNHGGGADD